MASRCRFIRCSTCRDSRWPRATGSFCASRRRIHASTWSRRVRFSRAFARRRWRTLRCNGDGSRFLLLAKRTSVTVLLCVLACGCRQDMHNQPKYIPYRPSTFFVDTRSERDPVAGTIARGTLAEDELLQTGKQDGADATVFPFTVDLEVLRRGQERFNIFCSPCHGRDGDGAGMVVQRGYRRPPTFHQDRLRQAPPGHFFDVMTSGFGAMPDY